MFLAVIESHLNSWLNTSKLSRILVGYLNNVSFEKIVPKEKWAN